MDDKKPQESQGPVARFFARYPLYVRIGFGAVILFGMVGNCAGHREGSLVVFMLTATVWACCRIVQEAIEATRVLMAVKEHDTAQKKPEPEKKDDPPPPPPPAVA
jgi:hypothetical protein